MNKTLIATAALLAAGWAQAQIAIGSPAAVYATTFDTLSASGTGQAWSNDNTLPGWSLFTAGGTAITTYIANDGGSNAGSVFSYGSTGSSERALGALGSGGTYWGSPLSGTPAGYIAVAFINGTGLLLDSFTASYAGEQWRNGGNATAHTMTVEIGTGAGYAAVANWAAAPASFFFTSPVASTTAASVNGNTAGRVNGLGGTVAVNWLPGETLWLRFVDLNESGNDHGLAIDDFSLTVTAVPEPGTVALWLAGLGAIGFVARRRRG